MFFRRKPRAVVELLIVGLGNPGAGYSATRHNVGWWVLDELKRRLKVRNSSSRHSSQVDYARLGGVECALIKPTTFMNLSGQSVAGWRREFPQARLLVIHDDISMAPGRCRLREEGSAGGHRGVQNIIDELHSERFDRLKIGVGAPPDGLDAADYVLAPPDAAELQAIDAAVLAAADAVYAWARGDNDGARRALANASGTPPVQSGNGPEK